jgi:hypothetical protein
LAKLHAAQRKPGYVAAVLAVAEPVSETHAQVSEADFSRLRAEYSLPRPLPGTEMKALLAKIGIVAKPTCSCNKRAEIMDEKGCDWCEEHIEEIDGWLAEEAKKRKLPYLSFAGKALIHLAIRRARKKGNSR